MSFEDLSVFFVRWGLSILAIYGGVVLLLISNLLLRTRLARHTRNLGVSLLIYGFARILAAILDSFIIYSFGIFTSFVTYCYFLWLDIFLTKRYNRLKAEDMTLEVKQRIAQNYDEIIEDMRNEQSKLVTNG